MEQNHFFAKKFCCSADMMERVVENDMQWKMLCLKENQKLQESHELDFQETPEPVFWILLPMVAGIVFLRKKAD